MKYSERKISVHPSLKEGRKKNFESKYHGVKVKSLNMQVGLNIKRLF